MPLSDETLIPIKVFIQGRTFRSRISVAHFTSLESVITHLTLLNILTNVQTGQLKYLDNDGQEVDLVSPHDFMEAVQVFEGCPSMTSLQLVFHTEERLLPTMNSVGFGSVHPLANALLSEISMTHNTIAVQVVNWWLRRMPEAYFREIDSSTRMMHLRALVALQMADQKQEVVLFNKARTKCTFIKPNNYVGLLSEIIASLPKDKQVREANIYTATDGNLVIDVFDFESPEQPEIKFRLDASKLNKQKVEEVLKVFYGSHLRNVDEDDQQEALLHYLSCLDHHYVMTAKAHEIMATFHLLQESEQLDNIVSSIEDARAVDEVDDEVFAMEKLQLHSPPAVPLKLMVVLKREGNDQVFPNLIRHLGRLEMDILKASMTRVDDYNGADYLVIVCSLRMFSGKPFSADLAVRVRDELSRLPYLDDEVFAWIERHKACSLLDAEILTVWMQLAHCLLAEQSPLVYTKYHMESFFEQYPSITQSLLAFWHFKFAPLHQTSISARHPVIAQMASDISQDISNKVGMQECALFLLFIIQIILHTLKVNQHVAGRMSLCLRLDALLLRERDRMFGNKEVVLPYGLFFVTGRSFIAFHVRVRDIARGGVKLSVFKRKEEYVVAHRSLLSNVLELAQLQDLKNKDIPESGAKAVILLSNGVDGMRACCAFADAMLDLTCLNKLLVADYLAEPELIYLGPDENITNEMIVWMAERASMRQHPFPNTFISSKQRIGIHHKDYAVTSIGILSFLDASLKCLSLTESFTLKLDGLNAVIVQLIHRYASRVKIVAVSDGVLLLQDAQGLDHSELIRMTQHHLPLSSYNVSKLKDGQLRALNDTQFLFQLKADVFLITSEQSHVIHASNVHHMLSEGESVVKILIESCNDYLTREARDQLSQELLILPSSCVNKSAVECSSFETLACMLLSEMEFNDIKHQYIPQVFQRLQSLADSEAALLFKLYQQHPYSLCELSDIISTSIIKLKQVLYQSHQMDVYVQALPQNETFKKRLLQLSKSYGMTYNAIHHTLCRELLVEYLPAALRHLVVVGEARHYADIFDSPVSVAGDEKCRLDLALPHLYKKRILATVLACKLIYEEGYDFLEKSFGLDMHSHLYSPLPLLIQDKHQSSHHVRYLATPKESALRITEWALHYLVEWHKTQDLVRAIEESALNDDVRVRIIRVLASGGTRIGMEMRQ